MPASLTRRRRDPPRHSRSENDCRLACFLLCALLLLAVSEAGAHDTRVDGDPSNDWIQGLANDDNEPCCGNNDCYPLTSGALKYSPESEFMVEIGDRWFSVPERKLLRDNSPDGRPWVCPKWKPAPSGYSYSVKGVRCLLLPMIM